MAGINAQAIKELRERTQAGMSDCKGALTEADGDMEVVRTYGNAEQLLAGVATLRPDLVTMDLELPGIDGVEATRRLMATFPVPVVVVSAHTGAGSVRADFVLGDRDGTTCEPRFTKIVFRALTGMGYQVKVNDPYKGVELVRAYSDPRAGRHSLQIEINKRLYMDEGTLRKTAGFSTLQKNLGELLRILRDEL